MVPGSLKRYQRTEVVTSGKHRIRNNLVFFLSRVFPPHILFRRGSWRPCYHNRSDLHISSLHTISQTTPSALHNISQGRELTQLLLLAQNKCLMNNPFTEFILPAKYQKQIYHIPFHNSTSTYAFFLSYFQTIIPNYHSLYSDVLSDVLSNLEQFISRIQGRRVAANFSAPGRLLMFVFLCCTAQHGMVNYSQVHSEIFKRGFCYATQFWGGGQDFAANVNISSSFKLLSGLKN